MTAGQLFSYSVGARRVVYYEAEGVVYRDDTAESDT
jgi:hypothetical protein